jgi:hypothetical protein
MVRTPLGALAVCLGCAVLVAVALHADAFARRVDLVDRSLVDRFLADQAALDNKGTALTTAQGLKQLEDENLAEGDDLSAGMQQHATAGLGALTGVDDNTARALRAADGAIEDAGLKGGRGSLLGDLTGTQLQSEMSDGGMPTASNNAHLGESLKEELEASRKELADVAAGGNGGKYSGDLGLSESALNSVAEGMEDGLDADSVDPTTGLATGQLALVPSKFSQEIAKRELRHVAGGEMAEGGTLTGLVSADAAFSGVSGGGAQVGGASTTSLHSDVQQRTVEELEHELKERQAMMARLSAGRNKAARARALHHTAGARVKTARARHVAHKAASRCECLGCCCAAYSGLHDWGAFLDHVTPAVPRAVISLIFHVCARVPRLQGPPQGQGPARQAAGARQGPVYAEENGVAAQGAAQGASAPACPPLACPPLSQD